MKNFTFWVLAILFTISLEAQEITYPVPYFSSYKAVAWNNDSIYSYVGNQAGGWILSSKQLSIKNNSIGITTDWYNYVIYNGVASLTDSIHQTYFDDGVTIKEYIRFQQENVQWRDTGQYSLFDRQGRKLYYLIHLTSDYGTLPAWKAFYTYNDAGKTSMIIKFTFDDNANAWRKKYKTIYKYNDTSGLIDSIIRYTWDAVNTTWKNYSKKLYSYTLASGQLFLDTVVYYSYDNNLEAWLPQAKHKYTYTTTGQVCDDYYYYFDQNTQNWIKYSWITKSYTDTLLQEQRTITYKDDGSILSKSKQTFSYNSQNLLVERISYDYNFDKQTYIPHSQYTYQYNDAGLKTNYTIKYWDTLLSTWVNAAKIDYFISQKIYSKISDNRFNIKIYPNPAADFVTIDGLEGLTNIQLLSLNGEILYSCKAKNKVILPLNSLKAGIYIIRLKHKQKQQDYKIIKLE